jgi:hypothetical protein
MQAREAQYARPLREMFSGLQASHAPLEAQTYPTISSTFEVGSAVIALKPAWPTARYPRPCSVG